MATRVYWTSRDLAGSPWGNHHFILITIGGSRSLTPIPTKTEGSTRFITLGGFNLKSRLMFKANDSSDVQAVREVLNPKKHVSWYSNDYDAERHRVKSPSGCDLCLAQKIVRLAQNYKKNEAKTNQSYTLQDNNCAAWVNTLLKVAGVSKANRLKYGEFSGIDWGEENLVPESLFK